MSKFTTVVMRMLAISMLLIVAGHTAAQQAYPNRPIRIVVPFPPGGSIDPLGRFIGQKLTESWGQQVIVDNRPGGNSIIGTEAVVKSKPDGYTLLLQANSLSINANLLATPYDPITDFAPIATLVSYEYVLVVNPSLPANTLQEFIAYAKGRPGQLNYASSGTASGIHLGTELFSIAAGVKMQHIPYKGAAPAITDLIGGQVQLVFQVPIVVVPLIKSGKLKPLAISGEARLATLPQVPTLTEAGLPGVELRNWNGLLAPAGTPREIVYKLAGEIAKILAMPDVRATLLGQGNDPMISTPDQFAAMLKAEVAKFGKIIKAANIKVEN